MVGLQAAVMSKEEEFSIQKKMVTERYLKLQEKAEQFEAERDGLMQKMRQLDVKVDVNEQ